MAVSIQQQRSHLVHGFQTGITPPLQYAGRVLSVRRNLNLTASRNPPRMPFHRARLLWTNRPPQDLPLYEETCVALYLSRGLNQPHL